MPLRTLHEIQKAIERLSVAEREALARWLYQLRDRVDGNRVAEPTVAYGAAPTRKLLTVEEYLELEAASAIRHEYIAGEIHVMAGATARHNRISLNLATALSHHLRGGPCEAYMADLSVRLQVDHSEIFYYPDVMVACGPQPLEQRYLTAPKLIIEVLSPSTEAVDRREKALNYPHIASLEEYVLIAQDRCEVTIQRRRDTWVPEVLVSLDATAEFRCLDLALPVEEIYRGVL